jgi:threonine aldolase
MKRSAARAEFASDNTAGICPEAWLTLQEANVGAAQSYGDDSWTARARELVRELFETDCAVYVVLNGTAANALALAQICQSHHSVLCHSYSHLQTDECGAPEFFTKGAKLLLVDGANGKIDARGAEAMIARQVELHAQKPRAISIAQPTELGTVYTPDEIRGLAEFARSRSLLVHMDGARFANAVAALGCTPKEISWQAGVDVLCFGGTKNGTPLGELVIFFRRALANDFEYRLKQSGELVSKMRFLAAPWIGLLNNDVWLTNAQHANEMAARLAARLATQGEIDIVFPVEANAVFVRMDEELVAALHERGWRFYNFIEPEIYRLMCSWASTDKEVAEFVADVVALRR